MGLVSMGSMGSAEPFNFRTKSIETRILTLNGTKIRQFSVSQKASNPSIQVPDEAPVALAGSSCKLQHYTLRSIRRQARLVAAAAMNNALSKIQCPEFVLFYDHEAPRLKW